MKAIRVHEFGGPQVMRIEDVPEPQAGSHQVVVAIKAAGVNPIDTYIRSGTYARKKPTLPYTPGFDGAGIVESTGPDVRRVKAGDRVYINGSTTGAYAEKALCAEENAYHLSANLSISQGAGIWVPYATAHHALFDVAKARPAETLMVHGASGGVGTAAVQIGRALGMRVIGTAGSEKGQRLVRDQGAHVALNHNSADLAEQIAQATYGRGPDIILEMLANVNLAKDLGMIAHRGRIVVIGNRGTIEINPRDAMSKDASILGMLLLNITPEETVRIAAGLAAGFDSKTLQPVVGKELPLDQAPRAHEDVLAPGSHGKIVLVP